MLFDRLAGIVERHLPQYQKMMGNARLFRIPPKEPVSNSEMKQFETKVAEGYDEESALVQNFGLPFNTIAIESTDGRHSTGDLAVVIDTIDKAKRVYSILGITKLSGEGFKLFHVEVDIFNNLKDGEILSGTAMYTKGVNIRKLQMWTGQKDHIEIEQSSIVPWDFNEPEYMDTPAFQNASNDGKLTIIRQYQSRLMGRVVRLNLATVVLYIIAINSPSHFVVEESPAEGLRESKKSVKRSCDRPHYIVLTPNEIRTRFISKPTETGRTVAAHERRAHYRKLTSERYVNARGKIIRVEAVWVGPSEAIVNKNRYKVLLDL